VKEDVVWDIKPGAKRWNWKPGVYKLTVTAGGNEKTFPFKHEELADYPESCPDTNNIVEDIVRWIDSQSG
jgi:hypothetical protein